MILEDQMKIWNNQDHFFLVHVNLGKFSGLLLRTMQDTTIHFDYNGLRIVSLVYEWLVP